jgi:copper chaperone CopZ
MKDIIFKVEGMKCGGCKSKIETAFGEFNSDVTAAVNLEEKTVTVSFDDQSPLELKKTIEEAGFNVTGMESK